jgi:hypothetical protein
MVPLTALLAQVAVRLCTLVVVHRLLPKICTFWYLSARKVMRSNGSGLIDTDQSLSGKSASSDVRATNSKVKMTRQTTQPTVRNKVAQDLPIIPVALGDHVDAFI